ncbi:HU family DNA-binding protein [Polaribacter gangjinensis]|uniref:DNA-binding protein n=1 Tax=Polaribacter gangjinensis TaxID=574710 RepID=A0A2S7WFN4_9FLAO|nr:HU family DNA-binding protein [Polaribacter gangjinensis]PQJ76101.1 DNA-binding protein [Polaribacter gangjinensis]
MALQYRITKRANNIREKSDIYIMQAVHTGKIDADELAEVISGESSLTEADIKAVLLSLGKKMQFYLQQGKIVELDAIGTFKMSFQCESATDPSQLKSPQSIKKFHINYQPTKKIKRLLKNGVPVLKEK